MPERSNGKKSTAGTTLDLLGDDEPVKPRAARKPAPALAPSVEPQVGGALFGGDDVDLEARHPADVPVGNFPAPSQIAQAAEADPFGEEDPFEDSVMARMLADEPAPIASPLRAAREDFQLPAEAVPVAEVEPMTEAGPDLDAFADPVAVPEVEQVIEPPVAEAIAEVALMPVAEAEPAAELIMEAVAEPIAEVPTEPATELVLEAAAPAMEVQTEPVPEPAPASAKKAKAAPAPNPAPGLTFERRYTEAGQDVWATTEWELRTASIVGSDGKIVFEQSGVEIPKAWSQLATNVVVSKYFRGQIGTLEREYSVKQLIGRVADRILEWGREGNYFASDADAEIYHDELRYILLHQHAAFNSPVWFNLGWPGRRQAVSACYITEVDDTMESILDLYKTEGMLFKDGSGSGHNLSPLRSSKEPLAAGGRSSGPIAFMKGLDASAGSIKSGGSTRRAAKMVILDADHPDIQEFVDCKKDAELKAHALIDAGYSGAFNVSNGAYDTVPFQNANHSVRVIDAFMQAVEADGPWDTKFRTTGQTAETLRAKDLLQSIAEGTWVCGDPGMQFDTISNDWHTCANTDRIYASNPCVTGDTLVATMAGWQRIDGLVGQSARVIGADGLPHFVDQIFPTGHKAVYKLRTKAGYEVTITDNHLVLTTERGDVAVKDVRIGEHVLLEGAGFGRRALPEMLALAVGLAVGDGCLSRHNTGTRQQETVILTMAQAEAPILEKVAVELNHQKNILRAGGISGRPGSVAVAAQSRSGTARLAVGSACVVDLFKELAVLDEGSSRKRFTPEVYALDKPSLAAVLRGLFTADGTVANYGDKSQYVSLDSTSQELLQQVQMLLLSFGIKAKLYTERRGGSTEAMLPDTNRVLKAYAVQEVHSLRVTRSSRVIFEREIGFDVASAKATCLHDMNRAFTTYKDTMTDEIVSVTQAGMADVFDLTEGVTHHFVANGLVVHNCSEFFFLNSTACNLSSLNLMKFREVGSGAFDTASFEHAVKIMITAQEMMVGFAHYPTEKITSRSHEYRPLGLGYANLGALLMAAGLPYDSDAGRAYAGAVTSLMTGRAYHQSAQVARDCGGPFAGYAHNREPMLRVMGKHRAAVDDIDAALIPETLLDAARTAWDETVELGTQHGYRNAQATVLAPTGTIGFLMDCDTTGIEPDIAIVKYKSLVGGGMMKIVNQTVPEALERLGYSEAERQSIIGFIDEHDTIEGATDLKPEHLPIFDCAFRPMNGTRSIHYRGHIKMMAAAQPFISGAISKCVTGETLLATGRGLIRIGSLYQNEKPDTFRPARLPLASLGGTRDTDAFYYGGGRPTLGVTLRSGHRITGTPNHRLLVAREGRLDWVRLDEIEPGEAVATQYGTDLWAETPPRLPAVTTPLYGSEKRVNLPETMTTELAWLLGAYAAEGHTMRSNWTITLTNSVEAVLERAVRVWQSEFGVRAVIERQPGKCPGVRVSAKRIVLFMEALGCGARASAKRIPDAILQSPREMVLSFLSGLMLDGYAVPAGTLARVAICLDAPLLLDDLQAILTNLGLVHSRISKKNNTNGKTYDEVYLTGAWAQQFAHLVPFMEPDKAASAARLLTRTFAQSTADVVPGIAPPQLLALIPKGRSGHAGKGTTRGEFNFLADPRTKQVSRRTLERVAALPSVVLPEWLQIILRDNLRFSPVTEVKETGVQTVYDVSVPVTHAFVGNGIVNHNTVNLPNSATPDDIAETYMEAWKLGIKAVAVYRDGSKRTQPLNMGKETPAADKKVAAAEAETLTPAVPKAVRRRLPNERDGVTHKFSIGGHEGYLTVGLYPDTRQPGEIFIRMSKEGSSISGLMDSFATAISLALQYGVPLQTLVDKFIHSRFEPSGFTGNKEIPMAKSVMDYIFRYLALRFLQAEDRHNVGLLADQPADDAYPAHDAHSGTLSNKNGSSNGTGDLSHLADTRTATLTEHEREIYRAQSDAPPCPECGAITIRSGACYKCQSCGTSLGCS